MDINKIEYSLESYGEILPCPDLRTDPLDTLIRTEEYIADSSIYINKKREKEIFRVFNHQNKKKKILVYGLGNVGGTVLISLRLLLNSEFAEHIAIYDKNPKLAERYELEVNQIHPPKPEKQVEVRILENFDKIPEYDIIVFAAAAHIPPLESARINVRDIQFPGNRRILDSLIEPLKNTGFMGNIIIVSDPVDILCTYLFNKLNILSSQITGMGLGVMAARANYILEKQGYHEFYEKGQIFGPHNEGVIAIPDKDRSTKEEIINLSYNIENLNFIVREKGYYPYIAPAISSVAYNILYALLGHDILSCVYIDGIYWGFRSRYLNGLWYPVIQTTNIKHMDLIRDRFLDFKKRTSHVLNQI